MSSEEVQVPQQHTQNVLKFLSDMSIRHRLLATNLLHKNVNAVLEGSELYMEKPLVSVKEDDDGFLLVECYARADLRVHMSMLELPESEFRDKLRQKLKEHKVILTKTEPLKTRAVARLNPE